MCIVLSDKGGKGETRPDFSRVGNRVLSDRENMWLSFDILVVSVPCMDPDI